MRDTSKFKPYNVKAITTSFRRVFEGCNIEDLSKEAYIFCTLYLGFIAHYDHSGFKATYEHDLVTFCKEVGSKNSEETIARYQTKRFIDEYGKPYCDSIKEIGDVAITLARKCYPTIKEVEFHRERGEAAELVSQLKKKYNL